MAERSKAADLSSVISGCAGSNPASSNNYIYLFIYYYKIWRYWCSGSAYLLPKQMTGVRVLVVAAYYYMYIYIYKYISKRAWSSWL